MDRSVHPAKRLFFRGYPSGISNNRLALDIGVGLAHLTGRALVPYGCTAPVRYSPPSLDRGRVSRPVSSIFDLYDVPVPWVGDHISDAEVRVAGARRCAWEPVYSSVFYHPATLPIDVESFSDFRNGRAHFYTFDADLDAAPDVQVDAATLGLYSTFFFVDDRARGELVRLMGAIRPKPPYEELARSIADSLAPFDAIHIRRGDFVTSRFTPRAAEVTGEEVARNLSTRFGRDERLLVCTDDSRDRAFFEPILARFRRAVFLDRLLQESPAWAGRLAALPHDDDAALSLVTQLVAARARTFAGTLYSTFTALIHRARGFERREPNFLFCYSDWPPDRVRFEGCEFLSNGSGRYSWNRTRFPVGPDGYCWLREWPEAFETHAAQAAVPEPEPPARAIALDAGEATIHGGTARHVRGERDVAGHVGFWTDAADHVTWDVDVDVPRFVRVEVRYSCPPSCSGAIFRVGVEGAAASVDGCVEPTPAWTAFSAWERVGELELPTGRRRIYVRILDMPRGAVMNLAGLRLVPARRSEVRSSRLPSRLPTTATPDAARPAAPDASPRAPFFALDRPRILYLALGTWKSPARARAVLDTWARDLPPGDRLFFAADDRLLAELGSQRVWPCVEAGGALDHCDLLPLKSLEGFRRARALDGWDFVVRLDDDTYAVPSRVSAILGELPPEEPLYAGGHGFEVGSETFVHSHKARLERGEAPFRWTAFVGGAGYVVTRAALEKAWPFLEVELSVAGTEDQLFGAAMHRGGVPIRRLSPFFHQDRLMERVVFGCNATIHHLDPADLAFLHRIAQDYLPLPFEVALATVGWGEVGINGALGYEGKRVRVDGRPHRRAISAHAPSEVLLRGPPGGKIDLKGALNDSAAEETSARFTAERRSGERLADLGLARRGRATPLVRVEFPGDGRLVLRAATDLSARCHSVWIWNVQA